MTGFHSGGWREKQKKYVREEEMCAFVILCSAHYIVITVKHNKSAAETLSHALIGSPTRVGSRVTDPPPAHPPHYTELYGRGE